MKHSGNGKAFPIALAAFGLMALSALPASAQPDPWQLEIQSIIGMPGELVGGDVVRFDFALTGAGTVRGVQVLPALAFDGYAAFKEETSGGSGDNGLVVGEVPVPETSLSQVLQSLEDAGFEVTAVHNHVVDATPRTMWVHFRGVGKGTILATALKSVLSQLTLTPATPGDSSGAAGLDATILANAIGGTGKAKSGIIEVTRDFPSDVFTEGGWLFAPAGTTLTIGITPGEPLTPPGTASYEPRTSSARILLNKALGPQSVIHFQTLTPAGGPGGTPAQAAMAAELCATPTEANFIIRTLRAQGISVAAVHNHFLFETPRLVFIHAFATGDSLFLAQAIGAAFDAARTGTIPGINPSPTFGPAPGPGTPVNPGTP